MSPKVAPNETQVWWQWVDRRLEERFDEYDKNLVEVMGEVVGDVRAQMREHCNREVGVVKREAELLKREFEVLSNEMRLVRGLAALREEVAEARKQVPKLPAITQDLKAEQARLERELAKVKDRIGKVRVDQALPITVFRSCKSRRRHLLEHLSNWNSKIRLAGSKCALLIQMRRGRCGSLRRKSLMAAGMAWFGFPVQRARHDRPACIAARGRDYSRLHVRRSANQ